MIRPNDETHGSQDTVPVTNSNQLLKAPEAARLLASGTRKLWELTNRGEIPHVRIGRAVRYDGCDLEAWIEKQKRCGSVSPVVR